MFAKQSMFNWPYLDMFGKWPPRYAYICVLFLFWNSWDRFLLCFIRWQITSMVQWLKYRLVCHSIGFHSCFFFKYSHPPSWSNLQVDVKEGCCYQQTENVSNTVLQIILKVKIPIPILICGKISLNSSLEKFLTLKWFSYTL